MNTIYKTIGTLFIFSTLLLSFNGERMANAKEATNDYFYENEYGIEENGYVIETEVDGPQYCTEIEEYDAEYGVCYIECDTPAQCDEMEAKIDAAIDALNDEYQDFSMDFKEFEGDVSELEKRAEVVYQIKNGEKFVVVSGSENAKHAIIKKWLTDISPDKFSDTYLSRLILISDSEDNSAAFVGPSSHGDPRKWDMFVNMKSMKHGEKEMVFTLIHEYAHILTLNNAQVDESIDQEYCKNYFIDEGCMKTNAYLNIFYHKFWDGSFNTFIEDPAKNYDKNPNAFVTEYAATNPVEDIAESFASFVFKKKNGGNTIAEQKIVFFYFYPELANMRDVIRDALKPIIRKRILK